MKRISKWLVGILIVVVVAIVIYLRITEDKTILQTRKPSAPLVRVDHPRLETITSGLQFTGDVLPIQQATITSKVSGTLEKVYVDMGTSVHQDELLALIDTTELKLQYQQAAATHLNSKLSNDRTQDLYRRNLVSKQESDNASTAFQIAESNYHLAAERLSYARITAPFAGSITRRFLDPGTQVTFNTTTLFTLMSLDQVKIIVHILEKDIPKVKFGMTAIITIDAYPDQPFHGKVTRFSDAVNPDTRTMAVEIDVPNPDHLLKPGMFANLVLTIEEHKNALTVPITAVLKDDLGNYLYAAVGDTARRLRITIGTEQDTSVEILNGIADTTINIITVGQQFVKPNSPVTIQP